MFNYYGTNNPVQIGDRILVRGWFGRARLGTIVYIPGQSKRDPELGDDEWAYKTDGGDIYSAGYFPEELPHAGKGIEFVSRPGNETEEVIQSYKIPPEQDGKPGLDFLAVIGCAVLVLIGVLAVVAAFGFIRGMISR